MRKRKGKRERKRERGSWRHGRIEMASWIRLFCAEIRKIPIANNIHQSVREHRLLSGRGKERKRMNVAKDGISAGHGSRNYRCLNITRARTHPRFRFFFFSFSIDHSPSFTSTPASFTLNPFFPRKWICFPRAKRLSFAPTPLWVGRMRRPDITMLPLTRANNDVVKSIPYTVNRMKNIWPAFSFVCAILP